jgi:hypothetical protein
METETENRLSEGQIIASLRNTYRQMERIERVCSIVFGLVNVSKLNAPQDNQLLLQVGPRRFLPWLWLTLSLMRKMASYKVKYV